MTEEQLNIQMKQRELNASADKPSENKRRRLIKGAVAIPIIMTLHSGAALARTSNIVGAVDSSQAHTIEMTMGEPQVVCVKGATDLGNGQYDLGDPVAAYPDYEKYIIADSHPESIALQGKNCESVNGEAGFMVSATAWLSVGPKIGGIM